MSQAPEQKTTRGRPKSATPSREKTLSLPADLVDRVDLVLHSTIEERVPHGAWSRYIAGLIRADMNRIAATMKGGPRAH